jgi:anti-anti-sigma factor
VNDPSDQVSLRIATVKTAPGTVRVVVNGELDFITADQLRRALLAMLDDDRPSLLDLDLSKIGFCDLQGLTALLAIREAAAAVGCRVVISSAERGTAWLLAMTQVNDLFDFRPQPVEYLGGDRSALPKQHSRASAS